MEDAETPLLERELDRLLASRTVIEIYRDRLLSEPLVGRLTRRSRQLFLMEKLGDACRRDGWSVGRIGDITRVKSGGRELGAIEEVTSPDSHDTSFPDVTLLEISSAITVFQRQFECVTLYVEGLDSNTCFIGEVKELDDDFLLLHQYGSMKTMDRSLMLIRLDEVTRVEAEGEYERELTALFKQRQCGVA